MSNVDFDTNSNTLSHHTAHSDIYVPTTTDGTPIRWIGDNDATIDGTLYEVGRFYKRSGLFQSYFRHHAVALSNGKLAIDSINSVYFISGKINDGHDFDNPCPPTVERLAAYNAEATAAGTPTAKPLKKIPDEFIHSTVIAEHTVEAEGAKVLRSLAHVFGHGETSDDYPMISLTKLTGAATSSSSPSEREPRQRTARTRRSSQQSMPASSVMVWQASSTSRLSRPSSTSTRRPSATCHRVPARATKPRPR